MKHHRWNLFNVAVFIAIGFILLLAIFSKPWPPSDYFVHACALRTLADGQPLEDMPIAHHPNLLRRHWEPYHLFWAHVLRWTRMPITDLMMIAGMMNVIVFLAGVWFLARKLSRHGPLPAVLLVVMMFVMGVGYRWSNEYYLSALPESAAYPSALAWGLSFFAIAFIHDWSQRGGLVRILVACVIAAFTAVIHPLTVLGFTIPFSVLWVWLRRVSFKRKVGLLVLPAIAIAVSALWPVSGLIAQARGALAKGISPGGTELSLTFVQPLDMLMAFGPLPAALLFFLWLPRWSRRPLAVILALYAVGWLGMTFLGLPLAHRAIFYLIFTAHLIIALAVAREVRSWRRSRRFRAVSFVPAAGAAALVLLIPWGPMHLWKVSSVVRQKVGLAGMTINPSPLERFENECAEAQRLLPSDSRILTDKATSVQVAAFNLPVMRGGGLGKFPPDIITEEYIEKAQLEAAAHKATHLLLRQRDFSPSQQAFLAKLGDTRLSTSRLVLIELKQRLLNTSSHQTIGSPSSAIHWPSSLTVPCA